MGILVSVVMPVYNSERYLKKTIESILNQKYKNFEFIIVNDGSNDRSREIIKYFLDKRIKFIDRSENRGIVYSLNEGIESARGKYIIRMDSDDIALPNRIEEQVRFMEKNPNIDISGTYMKKIGTGKIFVQPINFEEIKVKMLFSSPLYHPTVIVKTEVLKKYKYPENTDGYEDYRLWQILDRENFIFGNLPKVLLEYRINEEGITQTIKKKYKKEAKKLEEIYKENLKNFYSVLELDSSKVEKFLSLNYSLLLEEKLRNKEMKLEYLKLIKEIFIKNKNNKKYDTHYLKKYLSMRWFISNIKSRSISLDKFYIVGCIFCIKEKLKGKL